MLFAKWVADRGGGHGMLTHEYEKSLLRCEMSPLCCEPELVWDMKRYLLDIIGFTSMHSTGKSLTGFSFHRVERRHMGMMMLTSSQHVTEEKIDCCLCPQDSNLGYPEGVFRWVQERGSHLGTP